MEDSTVKQQAAMRVGTHWDGCWREGGPRHYACAVVEAERLRAALAQCKESANEWRERAEAAETKLAAVPVQAMLECILPDDYDFSASLAAVGAFAIWLEAQREQQSEVQP